MSAEIADELRRIADAYGYEQLRAAADALDAKDKQIAELEAALTEIAAGPHLLSCDKAKWADWAADRAASSLPDKEDRNG